MGNRGNTIKTESITPTFRGVFLERFLRLIEAIDSLSIKEQHLSICKELEWCKARPHNTIDQLKCQAMLLVLRDLIGQGWQTRFRQQRIFIARPDYTRGKHLHLDPAIVKNQIRSSFQDERLAQICTPSTTRFIRAQEQPPVSKQSIAALITDGKELSSALRQLSPDMDPESARKYISPYLQLVRAEKRDPHTGLKLTDIWRYFRYTWAIPYQPTPGRNLFYLVRDAARPFHPVMGIAALGNCVVQLSERDLKIGWNLEAIEQNLTRRGRTVTRELPKGSAIHQVSEFVFEESEKEHLTRIRRYSTRLANSLLSALDEEFALINLNGLGQRDSFLHPTEDLIRQLLDIAASSEQKRQSHLRKSHENGESVKKNESSRNWSEDTKNPLFVRKRAQALADILFTRQVFEREKFAEKPLEALTRMLKSDDGRKALRIALHSNKKSKIGCNMMDIIVCGAIPPYGEMLGGKLVAMLMASPQVVADYNETYGNQPSEISSRLAGREVIRSADLVFLTTTSLYHVGSSQYERIRIPGPQELSISFEFIGHTEGYGSTVFTSETTECLREISIRSQGMRRINNIFGEGVSPRLRMVREGLALIGIPQDLVMKHNCPRLIYGVRLASNAFEYLRGEEKKPKYVFPLKKSAEGTHSIIDHWLKRWLLPRAQREESLAKVERFTWEQIRLGREIPPTGQDITNTESEPQDAENVHHL